MMWFVALLVVFASGWLGMVDKMTYTNLLTGMVGGVVAWTMKPSTNGNGKPRH